MGGAGGGGGGGADEEALPARSRPPMMKTYEARSRIGLKLKIKQEAGLSKVIHNTALDPPAAAPAAPPAAAQINGSLEKKPPSVPAASAASAPSCRLPLRKSYRDSPELRRQTRRGKSSPDEASDGEEEEDNEDEEGSGRAPLWGGKRRRAALDVESASFSSESPPDDSLSEHLQSAIDSILNLQQPRGTAAATGLGGLGGLGGPGGPGAAAGSRLESAPEPGSAPELGSAPGSGSGSGSVPGPPRRPHELLVPPPSHNGALGAARTCTR